MKPYLLGVAVVAVIALAIAGAWYLAGNAEPGEAVTISISPREYNMLVYVAEDQGYFSGNGLNVTVRDDSSGLAALQAMERNEADLAIPGEYPFVVAAVEGQPISIIGCIDRPETQFLVGRTESGIGSIPDLTGKRVGVLRASQTEFILGRFLELNGMNVTDVTMVDIPTRQSVDVLANGSVDACVVRSSELDQVRKRLGSAAVIWPAQKSQPGYVVLAGRNDWLAAHPRTAERVLRSLARAEEFAVQHPDDAKAIVGRRVNLTDANVDEIWPQNQFGLTLDRSLLTAMTDEARWMIRNNLTSATTVPDFAEYIDPAPLASVNPAAVNIVGAAGTGSPAGTEARR